MNAPAFVPREGTHSAKLLDFLRMHPGEQFRTAVLRDRCGIPQTSMGNSMKPLLDAGLVSKTGAGYAVAYQAADAPRSPHGPLLIEAFSDGDVHVLGGSPTEEDGVLYTREQLQQLLVFVTRPLVQLPGASQ